MKHIWSFCLFVLAGVFLFGCKTEMMDYEGKPGVYFANQQPFIGGGGDSTAWPYSPVTEVPFITTASVDSLVKLRVKLLGNLVNKDRTFKMVVVDSGTTALKGTDYDLPEENHIIKANEAYTDVFVQVYRAPSLKDTSRKVMFTLVETSDFALPIDTWYPAPGQNGYSPKPGAPVQDISVIRHTILLSDVITNQPTGWWAGFYGDFSKEKYQFLADYFELTWDDFSREKMDTNRARALGQRAKYRLEELEAEGTPVLEADGTPMKMGPLV